MYASYICNPVAAPCVVPVSAVTRPLDVIVGIEMSTEPSNLTPLMFLAVASFVAVAAFPVVFWLPVVFTPGRLILAEPSNATPPIERAVFNFVAVSAFPVSAPVIPPLKVWRALHVLAVLNRGIFSPLVPSSLKPRFRIEMMTPETSYKAWKQPHHR
ncbi:Uncharacterised protein [Escherichia coli]|nr:Uncharacterised protein [Escherichia coli]